MAFLRHPKRVLSPRLIHIGLALTLMLATALRFYQLAGQSLWSDEGNSVTLAQASLAEIAARTAMDIHPPLYYWLLHSWVRIFGYSEVAVRSLSAMAGVLLVAVVYQVGLRLFPPDRSPSGQETSQMGQRVGLLAAFFAAVSPFQVYYAQEGRMYALLALLGALTVWATLELIETPSRNIPRADWALLYVFSAALGLYTHYAFPVVLAATNGAVLLQWWRSRRVKQLVSWLGLQLVPLALYLPWLPIAWRQLTTWPAPPPIGTGNAFVTAWRTLVLGPAGGQGNEVWLAVVGVLGLIGVFRLLGKRPLPRAMLVLLWLGLPVGLTLALFKPAYLKFLLVASPGLCLLLAAGLTTIRPGKATHLVGWLGAILIAAAAWGPLSAYYTDPTVARDDYRGMAHYLEAVAGPEDAIILNAAGQQEVFGYYYHGDAPVYPLPRHRPLDPGLTVTELESILAEEGHIYAIYWATEESDPEGIIEGWLDEHTFKATDAWVGNVRLVSYAVPLASGDLVPIESRLGEHVTLTGYRLLSPSPAGDSSACAYCASRASARTVPGEIVQVELRWMTDTPLDARYVVFGQVLDEANHLVGQRDAEPTTPSVDWLPGQPVLDRHGLLVEPGTPPGVYRVIVGLYDAASGQRLPISSEYGSDFVELGRLSVERPGVPPPIAALSFRRSAKASTTLGPLRLLGYDQYKLGHSYDPDTPLRPGNPLHLVLYWQVQNQPQTDWQVALRLAPVTSPTAPVTEGLFPAAGVNYPTRLWEPGEVVRAQFDLFLPGDIPAGKYQMSLHLVGPEGSPAEGTFTLNPISVE